MNSRRTKGTIVMVICGAAALFAAGMLLFIVGTIFVKGVDSLTLHFILVTETEAGRELGTGIANAIAGTFLLAVLSTVLAIPFAIGTAIYLQKYAPDNHLTRFLRLMIEVLSGTPSIVLGIFGLLVLVIYLKPITGGESLIAGSIALGALILPVIERATEDAISRVPKDLEEGSYALGATKWLTIRNIVIPSAFSGIIVGAILGFGRAAEESAVVLMTAGYSQYLPEFKIVTNPQFLLGVKIYPLNQLMGSLPTFIYTAYENVNVFPESSIFAAGFVLIMMVMLINISAKAILFYSSAKAQGHQDNHLSSLFGSVSDQLRRKKPKDINSCIEIETAHLASKSLLSGPEKIRHSETLAEPVPDPHFSPDSDPTPIVPPGTDPRKPSPRWKQFFSVSGTSIRQWFHALRQKVRIPVPGTKDKPGVVSDTKLAAHGSSRAVIRPFLRTLFPFAIPAALLLLIAFLATIPPLHAILGPASPALAGLFASGLSGIVTVSGLIFALIFVKRRGAFKVKNRSAGYAAVATGFCILCIAGIICSSAAAGLFTTGEETSGQAGGNRSAQLAAMIASGEPGGEQGSIVSVQTVAPTVPAPSPVLTQVAPGTATNPVVPVKDALGVGESYWFGDAEHTCRATVYDYKVLPFYFWWFIDYNRFVQQVPPAGYSYLVVFLRIEDLGTKSAIIPSADQIVVTNDGNSYTNNPFFNMSVLSSWQINYYSTNLNQLPYQWIREIGQDKRDYAYLMGYNIFSGGNGELTSNLSENSGYLSAFNETQPQYGLGYFLHPGTSNAIDGYLIYTVPTTAVNTTEDLKSTYVQFTFNNISYTRWQLGQEVRV